MDVTRFVQYIIYMHLQYTGAFTLYTQYIQVHNISYHIAAWYSLNLLSAGEQQNMKKTWL